jgi:ElaB/YqjD/DUF883 family membrane-anchored ribosome-binding protein
MASTSTTSNAVAEGLEHLVDEAENLLKNARRTGEDQLGGVREKLSSQLNRAKADLLRLEENALDQAHRAARVTDHTVRAHPYAAVALAAGVGVLLGLLFSRRD